MTKLAMTKLDRKAGRDSCFVIRATNFDFFARPSDFDNHGTHGRHENDFHGVQQHRHVRVFRVIPWLRLRRAGTSAKSVDK